MLLFLLLHRSQRAVQTPIQHQTTRARDHLNEMALLDPLLMVPLPNHQYKARLRNRLRTTLLPEARTRGTAFHHTPMVVVVLTTYLNETRTGTKTVTITKVTAAGAIRSTGIKIGLSAGALMGEMGMHNHKEVLLQRL